MPHQCSAPLCALPHYGLGYCRLHWKRFKRHGDPLACGISSKFRDPFERFFGFVDFDGPIAKHHPDLGPCWLWTGSGEPSPLFCFKSRTVLAHRWFYRRVVGEIPRGLVLDHFACDNGRHCVNFMHVRPATVRENALRSEIGRSAQNARKTHCQRGHPLDRRNKASQRYCSVCENTRAREYQRRKRAERLILVREEIIHENSSSQASTRKLPW